MAYRRQHLSYGRFRIWPLDRAGNWTLARPFDAHRLCPRITRQPIAADRPNWVRAGGESPGRASQTMPVTMTDPNRRRCRSRGPHRVSYPPVSAVARLAEDRRLRGTRRNPTTCCDSAMRRPRRHLVPQGFADRPAAIVRLCLTICAAGTTAAFVLVTNPSLEARHPKVDDAPFSAVDCRAEGAGEIASSLPPHTGDSLARFFGGVERSSVAVRVRRDRPPAPISRPPRSTR